MTQPFREGWSQQVPESRAARGGASTLVSSELGPQQGRSADRGQGRRRSLRDVKLSPVARQRQTQRQRNKASWARSGRWLRLEAAALQEQPPPGPRARPLDPWPVFAWVAGLRWLPARPRPRTTLLSRARLRRSRGAPGVAVARARAVRLPASLRPSAARELTVVLTLGPSKPRPATLQSLSGKLPRPGGAAWVPASQMWMVGVGRGDLGIFVRCLERWEG